jgi:hypothetical protein
MEIEKNTNIINDNSKHIVFYGNCQCKESVESFKKVPGIKVNYCINFVHIKTIKPNEHIYPKYFHDCDVFIYQPLEMSGYEVSYILNNILKKDCKIISFPYIYFSGYWPDYFEEPFNKRTIKLPERPYGEYPYGFRILNSIINFDYNLSFDKIMIDYEQKLKHEEIDLKKTTSLKILKEKEIRNNIDIRFADFIEENYKKVKLFDTVNHPSNILLERLFNQICEKINIKAEFIPKILDNHCTPIHPKVQKYLNLEFDCEECVHHLNKISRNEWYSKYIDFLKENMENMENMKNLKKV